MDVITVIVICIIVYIILGSGSYGSKDRGSARIYTNPFCLNATDGNKCKVRKKVFGIFKPTCVQEYSLGECKKQVLPSRPPELRKITVDNIDRGL